MKPLVSILCIAYNQEKFIAQTLDGFVMQQTAFPFEVLIHDDASPDKTAQIIRKYQKAHPDIIKPIYETENQYSKGTYEFINDMFRAAKGSYIAFCEGDDYWTDPTKLQRQVDFMEKHPDHSLCFHPVRVIFEDGKHKPYTIPDPDKKPTTTIKALLERNDSIQTCTVMYRRQDYRQMPNNVMPHDWYLHLYHAQFGKIGFIDKTMAVYRRHSGGVWWGSHQDMEKVLRRHGLAWVRFYKELLEIYGGDKRYREFLEGSVITIFNRLADIDEKYGDNLVPQALAAFPDGGSLFVHNLYKEITALDDHSKKQADIIEHHVNLSQQLEARNRQLTEQNTRLKSRLLIRLGDTVKKGAKRLRGRRT